MASKPAKPVRSLMKFARDKRKKDCPVCALPAEVRNQLKGAGAVKIQRPVQLEWLRDEHKVKISDAQLTLHYSGRHDAEE